MILGNVDSDDGSKVLKLQTAKLSAIISKKSNRNLPTKWKHNVSLSVTET